MLSQRHSHDDDHPNDSNRQSDEPTSGGHRRGEDANNGSDNPMMKPATPPIIAAPKTPRQMISYQTLIVRGKVGSSSCIVTPRAKSSLLIHYC